jgi:glycine/D-amino acid oxidase-like deaminating enzyme
MLDCVRRTKELVDKEQLDCDLEYNGLLVLARNAHQMRQLEAQYNSHVKAGSNDVEMLTGAAFEARLNSAWHIGALYEPETAILNPAKLCHELKRVIVSKGVKVYERSKVEKVTPGDRVLVATDQGTVTAHQAVLALNAYGLPLKVQKNRYFPMHTYIVLTEPLSDKLYEDIGWVRREGIEDARQMVHYMRLTADNRILLGGRDCAYYFGNQAYGKESHAGIHRGLEADIKGMFPMLKETKITHCWGGPVAITPLMVPTFGYHRGNSNIAYATGYCGHGVALSLSAGMITRDLLMNPEADYLKELLFVHNNPFSWPVEPFRYPIVNGVKGAMMLYDKWVERNAKGRRSAEA